jgi:hypothetical protein
LPSRNCKVITADRQQVFEQVLAQSVKRKKAALPDLGKLLFVIAGTAKG